MLVGWISAAHPAKPTTPPSELIARGVWGMRSAYPPYGVTAIKFKDHAAL